MADERGASDEVERLLERIAAYDGDIGSVCTLSPIVREQARALDEEASAGRVRGPLHGRAVLVKDNVDTADLPTTAGSLALASAPPPGADAPHRW